MCDFTSIRNCKVPESAVTLTSIFSAIGTEDTE